MNIRLILLQLALFPILASFAPAVPFGNAGEIPLPLQAKTGGGKLSLEEILAGLDGAAPGFRAMSGDLEYTKVTVVVDDHSVQTGRIAFQKNNGKTRVLISFTKPVEKYVSFDGGKVSLYQPRIAEVDEYPLAKRQDLLEQFLLLGFGTPGSELKKSYQIALRGEESIGGRQAVLLELTPKSENVASHLTKIQLWLSPDNWEPVQQKFYEPGGDYLIARYGNVKINPKLSDKSFKLPVKGKVKVVRPQG